MACRTESDQDVIKSAHWLSMQNKMIGDIIARREYLSIMECVVELALKGNIPAAKFCAERAWPEDKRAEKSATSSLSLGELFERSEREYDKTYEIMTPTWLKERNARLAKEFVPPVTGPMGSEAESNADNLNTYDTKEELP